MSAADDTAFGAFLCIADPYRTCAGRFGVLHPTWADPGDGREKPWHWECAGS